MAFNQQNVTMPVYVQSQQHSYAQAPPPPYPQLQYQQFAQPAQAVHVYTVQAIAAPMLGRHPSHMRCPICHAEIMTTVKFNINQRTHIMALILCFFTGCCCLPYCFNTCKGATHYCPNCNSYLGSNYDDLL